MLCLWYIVALHGLCVFLSFGLSVCVRVCCLIVCYVHVCVMLYGLCVLYGVNVCVARVRVLCSHVA